MLDKLRPLARSLYRPLQPRRKIFSPRNERRIRELRCLKRQGLDRCTHACSLVFLSLPVGYEIELVEKDAIALLRVAEELIVIYYLVVRAVRLVESVVALV